MAAPKISPKKAVKDVRAGLSKQDLMEKYKLSAVGLHSLLRKLVSNGFMEASEIDHLVSSDADAAAESEDAAAAEGEAEAAAEEVEELAQPPVPETPPEPSQAVPEPAPEPAQPVPEAPPGLELEPEPEDEVEAEGVEVLSEDTDTEGGTIEVGAELLEQAFEEPEPAAEAPPAPEAPPIPATPPVQSPPEQAGPVSEPVPENPPAVPAAEVPQPVSPIPEETARAERVTPVPPGIRGARIPLHDLPLTDPAQDRLGMDRHASAIAEFVSHCDTPAALCLQGDGGTGRTSLLNLIKIRLDHQERPDVTTIMFNCREHGTFDLLTDPPLFFLIHVAKEIMEAFPKQIDYDDTIPLEPAVQEKRKRGEEVGRKILGYLWEIARATTELGGDAELGFHVAAPRQPATNDQLLGTQTTDEGTTRVAVEDYLDRLREIKTGFRSLTADYVKASGSDGIVILIDDLERLDPEHGVALLENVNAFLAIKHVSVVACCRPEFVEEGIAARAGLIGWHQTGAGFFHRVFQSTFALPAEQYDVREYVQNLLDRAGVACSDADLGDYVALLRYSVGTSPRAVKTLANTLILRNRVQPAEPADSPEGEPSAIRKQKLLFALACWQSAFPRAYELLLTRLNDDRRLATLLEEEFREEEHLTDAGHLGHAGWGPVPSDDMGHGRLVRRFMDFMDVFFSVLDLGGRNGRLTPREMAFLRETVDLMAAVGPSRAVPAERDRLIMGIETFCSHVRERLRRLTPAAPSGISGTPKYRHTSTPWVALWPQDGDLKEAWKENRLRYELRFDTDQSNSVTIGLKGDAVVLGRARALRKALDELELLPIVGDNRFQYREEPNGWVAICKELGPVSCASPEDVKPEEVERVAEELVPLVEATHGLFDAVGRRPRPAREPEAESAAT